MNWDHSGSGWTFEWFLIYCSEVITAMCHFCPYCAALLQFLLENLYVGEALVKLKLNLKEKPGNH